MRASTEIELYSDGAVSNNGYEGAIGGWAFGAWSDMHPIYFKSEQVTENPTNQRCELLGAINAFEWQKETFGNCHKSVVLFTDSAYVANAFNQNWITNWEKNGWRTADKKEVANRDLWDRLIPFYHSKRHKVVKVDGHADDRRNNYIDKLAVEAKEGRCTSSL